MGISITTIGNKICREFHDEMDIYPSVINRAGVFIMHVPTAWTNNLAMDLYDRGVVDSFRLIVKICGHRYKGIVLIPHENVGKVEIDALLNYMHERKIAIKWKEGRCGYEISREGKILRKWDLKPAKVVDVEVVE